MDAISQETTVGAAATRILADLVGIASLPGTPNAEVTDCLASELARPGVRFTTIKGPEGDRTNVFASIGPADRPGYILSGHSDVVPVAGQDWATDPFRLTAQGDRLYGRGTTDMKGFVACMLALVPEFLAMDLARPVHIAVSYDEEIGCRGVGHMIAALPGLCGPPMGCIVGEPSDLHPVLSHKGKLAAAVQFTGRPGHSSDPRLGLNAIYPAAELTLVLRDLAAQLEVEGPFDPQFSPAWSTLQAGVIQGGQAVNIIPALARLEFEVRTIPGVSPVDIAALVRAAAERIAADQRLGLAWEELSSYPALPPPEDPGLASLLSRLSGRAVQQSVSYGTEAGLFHAAGVPSVICGPGSITRAHRADEFITKSELGDCLSLLRRTVSELCCG
ncbi:acetylornithine deacetylase [Paracoccus sp. IB05]|uniref:acetylornithine deacetylase n=1 Tax=Paracoccus sp. IB05 TaxID=2779367 RepID=UPI0018E7209D|nr:acetylornithine deacetylase [Paracoccus sp. IB05]MBJ2152849.1 acetylornithine deacetylase [Paracoccus sp. IB05]